MMKLPAPRVLSLIFRVCLGLVLLLVGVGVFFALKGAAPELETADPGDRSLRVQVFEAKSVVLPRQWRGFGTTMAKDTADVPARVGTTVVKIPDDIEVGRVVAQGQILAELDATDFQRELEATTAQLAELDAAIANLYIDEERLTERLALEQEDRRIAQEEYERMLEEFEGRRASQQDVDRTQRAVNAAARAISMTRQAVEALVPQRTALDAQRQGLVARQAAAKTNVERCTITSPMDGIIEAIDVEEGENLAPGQRVARIIDPRLIEVPLQLPASARAQVEVGNTVSMTIRNLPPDCPPWEAQITRIGINNDAATRTFTAYALLDQRETALSQIAAGGGIQRMPIGAFVASTLTTSQSTERWVVPARSIREGRIRLVVDGKIVSRAVQSAFEYEGDLRDELGLPDTQWVVLASPLQAGEQVVVSASVSVLDGQRVTPVPPQVMARDNQGADPPTHGGAELTDTPAPTPGDQP